VKDWQDSYDIVEQIPHYIRLESHNDECFIGTCPFCKAGPTTGHTPTLQIDAKHQTWWCSYCEQGGDLIQFAVKFVNQGDTSRK